MTPGSPSIVEFQTEQHSLKHLTEHAAGCLEHAAGCLERLTDRELLASTKRLVGRSNQVFAALLAHLAEVEARGVHRTRACASLYTYCIYELRLSEDAAFRRVTAARLVKRFPVLLGVIERGELHLTGLLMLGPHLTVGNHLEVLARAKFRTKKEIARLVRILSPLPSVPARIEPLGPAPARPPTMDPSWATVVQLPVRNLVPGERPADWIDGEDPMQDPMRDPMQDPMSTYRTDERRNALRPGEPFERDETRAREEPMDCGREHGEWVAGNRVAGDTQTGDPIGGANGGKPDGAAFASTSEGEVGNSASAANMQVAMLQESALLGSGRDRLEGPNRYLVQFTATEEYITLYEEAKDLLSHIPGARTLEVIHLRAMRAFVAALKQRKYAVKDCSPAQAQAASKPTRTPKISDTSATSIGAACSVSERTDTDIGASADRVAGTVVDRVAGTVVDRVADTGAGASADKDADMDVDTDRDQDKHTDASAKPDACGDRDAGTLASRRRGRYVSARVRRAVFERDGGCCTYLDERGQRCREKSRLEFHHVAPFARGGPNDAQNLTLRCVDHNSLAADEDFGRDFMSQKRDVFAHGSYTTEGEEQRA